MAEEGSRDVLDLWAEAAQVSSVSLGYLEVRAAIARRLRGSAAAGARRRLDEYWQAVETVSVDDRLLALAVRLADDRRLRTLDALHLAAATAIQEPDLVFATWDDELAGAAASAGFVVVP